MDLYSKVERVIRDHIIEHQSEVRKGKELLSKLDVARCNTPAEDYSFDLTATGEKIEHSKYYYDRDRNREFNLREAEYYNKRARLDAQSTAFPDYTELPD